MSELIVLAIILPWLVFLKFVVNWTLRRLPEFPFKAPFRIVIYILLIPLPVIDEIIGGFQFRALCKEGAVLKVDAEKIKGKTVRKIYNPPDFEYLAGTVIPIAHSHLSYQDVITGEEYMSFNIYIAKIGWLRRIMGYPNTVAGICGSQKYDEFDKQYQFVIVNNGVMRHEQNK